MEKKKQGIFSRIKRWWKEDLSDYDREQLKVMGVFGAETFLIGSAVTSAIKGHRQKKVQQQVAVAGYLQGKLDAYKEIAQEPFIKMNAGMRKLEQQGKTTKF